MTSTYPLKTKRNTLNRQKAKSRLQFICRNMSYALLTCSGLKKVENEKRVNLPQEKCHKWIGIVSTKEITKKSAYNDAIYHV